jgi:hypothetical protein
VEDKPAKKEITSKANSQNHPRPQHATINEPPNKKHAKKQNPAK